MSCVAELLVRDMISVVADFWYVSTNQPATDSEETSINKRVKAIKGADVCYFVLSLLEGCLFMTRLITACLVEALQLVIKALGLWEMNYWLLCFF